MQLPPALREAIERELEGVPLRDLARASSALSGRYRAEVLDGRLHVDDAPAARAYLATRLPATFAAVAKALQAVTEVRPDFAPGTLLDAGAGPGTATWAAAEIWGSLQDALLVEASAAMRAVGERLSVSLAMERIRWMDGRLEGVLPDFGPRDLVLMAYVLDELPARAHGPLVARLWQATGDTLVVVEPGTSAGWRRILEARELLIGAGAHLLAPCPHHGPCPLAAPDWCHFSARLPRSRRHRQAKGGTVPWEDEKFIYLAVSRRAPDRRLARVIAPAQVERSGITLKLCQTDGAMNSLVIAKRDRVRFRAARRVDWGDRLALDAAKVR